MMWIHIDRMRIRIPDPQNLINADPDPKPDPDQVRIQDNQITKLISNHQPSQEKKCIQICT